MNYAIEIENFSYKYPDGTEALKDINLVIEPGERVALIGPNGAGKSTLFLAISGFVNPSGPASRRGRIHINGIEVVRKNLKKIRCLLGCVLQNPDEQLFMPTLFDDVAFGPLNMGLEADEVVRRAQQALKTVGLAQMAHRAPHHLSAGQKRSAAIATILSMSPKIITMDEPDSDLDPRSRNNLLELLRHLEQTLVLATCNMNFAARLCGRAVLIDGGQIIADGEAAQVMGDSKLMLEHGLETPTVPFA